MTKFKVGLDIDDTLTSGEVGIKLINEWFGIDYENHPNRQFDLSLMLGISREEEQEFWTENYDRFVSEAILNTTAIPMLNELKRLDAEFVLVTARPDYLRERTTKWAEEVLPLKLNDIILVGGHDKTDALYDSGVNFFVDDRAENIQMIKADPRLQNVVTAVVPKEWSIGANADLLVDENGKFQLYDETLLKRRLGVK